MAVRVNLCSGQRKFEGHGWVNVDTNPKWTPDIVADGASLPMFADNSVDLIVISHGLEHFALGRADSMLKECHRILSPGSSLVVTVPDQEALARAWLEGRIDDYIYTVNQMGAYMDSDADCHRWNYCWRSLKKTLEEVAPWDRVIRFDGRDLKCDLAADWWILGGEAVK